VRHVRLLQDACIRPACRLTEKLVNGQCRPVITGHSGFCFDFRFTAYIESPVYDISGSDDLIFEVLANTKLFPPQIPLRYQTKLKQVKTVQATDAGNVKIDIIVVVKVDHMVRMQAAYDDAAKGLRDYNVNATWNDARLTIILTPTRFKNISREVTEMAMFHDSTGPIACRMVYAMADIQACDGVETETFTHVDNHYIKVMPYLFDKVIMKTIYCNTEWKRFNGKHAFQIPRYM